MCVFISSWNDVWDSKVSLSYKAGDTGILRRLEGFIYIMKGLERVHGFFTPCLQGAKCFSPFFLEGEEDSCLLSYINARIHFLPYSTDPVACRVTSGSHRISPGIGIKAGEPAQLLLCK